MKQQAMKFRTWGGKRDGAGRKPRLPGKPGVPHRSRPALARRMPLHVTMRVASHVYNLRSQRSLKVIRAALHHGADRFGAGVVQISIQGNHLHMLVEADDHVALGRAMKGLGIRFARGLNRMMCRGGGRVFVDRYHSRVLKTPTEVRHVIHYLRNNRRHHLGAAGALLPASYVDPYACESELALPAPTLWAVKVGRWRERRGK
jgi:REP element-mobilizing transposase RayT